MPNGSTCGTGSKKWSCYTVYLPRCACTCGSILCTRYSTCTCTSSYTCSCNVTSTLFYCLFLREISLQHIPTFEVFNTRLSEVHLYRTCRCCWTQVPYTHVHTQRIQLQDAANRPKRVHKLSVQYTLHTRTLRYISGHALLILTFSTSPAWIGLTQVVLH